MSIVNVTVGLLVQRVVQKCKHIPVTMLNLVVKGRNVLGTTSCRLQHSTPVT